MIELQTVMTLPETTIRFEEGEKLSDILEREWPQEQWTRLSLRTGDRYCVVGKLFDLAGDTWERQRFDPEAIYTPKTLDGGREAFLEFLERHYSLDSDQIDELVRANNDRGRDAAIDLLRRWGR